MKDKSDFSTFAIYKKDDIYNPLVFISHSENLLIDWLTQVSVYCSRLCGFYSVKQALTITSLDGYAYLGYVNKAEVNFVKQISTNYILKFIKF